MNVDDPRERYDDLIEVRNEREIGPETFDALADNEAFTAGWAVGDDLSEPDEAIEDARWFTDVPEDLFDREYSTRVIDRIRRREG